MPNEISGQSDLLLLLLFLFEAKKHGNLKFSKMIFYFLVSGRMFDSWIPFIFW